MLAHYVRSALRSVARQKGYTAINIIGLAVGMSVSILIFQWVLHEISYDTDHANYNRTALVVWARQLDTGQQLVPTQQSPLGPLLKNNIPGIEEYVRLQEEVLTLAHADESSSEAVTLADPSILSVFSYPLVRGNPASVLTEPWSIVLTETTARKYFGDEDPIGQSVTVEGQFSCQVTGILRDIPANTSLRFDALVPLQVLEEIGADLDRWAGADYTTWVLLSETVSCGDASAAVDRYCRQLLAEQRGQEEVSDSFFLHPLSRYHLYSLAGDSGRITYVYALSVAAIVILAIACLNFVNLSTARSATRTREIGVRKVVGAHRTQIARQLLTESLLMSVVSLALALTIAELVLPLFNELSGKELSFHFFSAEFVALALGVIVITGVLAGFYPALVVSSLRPAAILRSRSDPGRSGLNFRRVLTLVQFGLSGILITASVVIYYQLDYMRNTDLGYVRENVVFLRHMGGVQSHYAAFKDKLLESPGVLDVTSSAQLITHINSTIGPNWDIDGKDSDLNLEIHFDWVSFDYDRVFGLEVSEGRFYSQAFPSDTIDGIVLNQSAVDMMGIDDPIGKRFTYWGRDRRIIGVVKDFHLEPLDESLKPLALIYRESGDRVFIRISADDIPSALAHIESVHAEFQPEGVFSYGFLDDAYQYEFRSESRMGRIAASAAVLALFVACLGMLGLASYSAERRTKEIGIRRVHGAPTGAIVWLLSREFLLLVGVSCAIGYPIAYLWARNWLDGFAYRADTGPLIFVFVATVSLVAALVSVGYQAIKAAHTNPVEALKYE
ncbi:MAG: ABC transporter permease [Candidatus Zixiibacteriota bacterium]|nr:MAG: ABC transporter permease [candidate division Zixibacteria bacterium]